MKSPAHTKEKQELDKFAKFLYNGAIARSIAFVAALTVFEARSFSAAQMSLLLVFAEQLLHLAVKRLIHTPECVRNVLMYRALADAEHLRRHAYRCLVFHQIFPQNHASLASAQIRYHHIPKPLLSRKASSIALYAAGYGN
jgi:hypothetical protein